MLDVDNGKSVASLPIGEGADGAEFDNASQTVFSANGEGTLTIIQEIDPNQYGPRPTLTTQRGARTLALDPATHKIYLPTANFANTPSSEPHTRPAILKDTFLVVVVGRDSTVR